MATAVASGRNRLLELLAAAAHGALVSAQFPNPRAMRGQALGQGVAWGGQNFLTPEALVAWINAHGGHTNVAQFERNHPHAFGQPVEQGPGAIGHQAQLAPGRFQSIGQGFGAINHAPGVKPPMPLPGPFDGGPPTQEPAAAPVPRASVPILAALIAHHLSRPRPRSVRRSGALSY